MLLRISCQRTFLRWSSSLIRQHCANTAIVRPGCSAISESASGFYLVLFNLWSRDQHWASKCDTLARPDFGQFTSLTRFKNSRMYVTATMAKHAAGGTNARWPLRGGVERFNTKRCLLLHTVSVCVLDESMFAWRPRSTKQGGLPHILYATRKPDLSPSLSSDDNMSFRRSWCARKTSKQAFSSSRYCGRQA
jgi:hypothetical protein